MNKLYLHKNKMRQGQLPLMGLVFFLLFFSASARGQSTNEIILDVPRVVPVSPAVAAMEKYQSYPVSHCTGIPDITVPLYEIVTGEVTIPVTLSYHSSGLKPKEQSGVAGTGWTLNLEPSVSRHINGVADDESQKGWFYVSNAEVPWRPEERREYYQQRVNNEVDIRPDKFIYKLANSGGSGYFQTRFSPLWTIPRNNDHVKFNFDSTMDITDETGVRYHFGEVCEKTGEHITRWLCNSIYSARNPREVLVNFSYLYPMHFTHPNRYYNLNKQLVFKDIRNSRNRTLLIDGTSCYEVFPPEDHFFSEDGKEAVLECITREEAGVGVSEPIHYINDDIKAAFLSEVAFLNHRIRIDYKQVGKNGITYSTVLDKIEVFDGQGASVRTIRFQITPYNDKTSLTKLDTVRISSPGVEDRVWAFEYEDPYRVPTIYTTSVDHWGFCNGPENDRQSSLPNVHRTVMLDTDGFSAMKPFIVNYPGASREPNPSYASLGILYRITDPQGIQTRFGYEGNRGAFRDNSKDKSHRDYLHPVGGLRISDIESYNPHTRQRIRKSYRYGLTIPGQSDYEPVWGGGAIRHIVTLRDYQSSTVAINKDPYINGQWVESMTAYSSMPVSNVTMHDGSSVMYNVVSESVFGDDGTQTTTKYFYNVCRHDFEDLLKWDDADPFNSVQIFLNDSITTENESLVRRSPYLQNEPSGDFTYGESNCMYGTLLRTEYYRGQELVSSVENSYSKKYIMSQHIQLSIPERYVVTDWEEYENSGYVSSFPAFLEHTEDLDISTHCQLDKTVTNRYYTSDGKRQVFTTEQRYTYEYDFFDPGFSLRPRAVETLRSDSTTVTDDYDYLLGYPAILSRHKHTEGKSCKESRILFHANSCLPQKVQSCMNLSDRQSELTDFRDEVSYRRYDSSGNIVEIAGKDGTPVSFLWSYLNSFPIVRIENATIDEVCAALAIESPDEWNYHSAPDHRVWSRINPLREKLPDARVTTYQYSIPHGLTGITDPNGLTTRFEYDNYGRLTNSYYLDGNERRVMLEKYVYHFGN